jgi:hypothetical protein
MCQGLKAQNYPHQVSSGGKFVAKLRGWVHDSRYLPNSEVASVQRHWQYMLVSESASDMGGRISRRIFSQQPTTTSSDHIVILEHVFALYLTTGGQSTAGATEPLDTGNEFSRATELEPIDNGILTPRGKQMYSFVRSTFYRFICR